MHIEKGKLTVLVGKSGSGKTTLMNILGALDPPTEGKVLFEGQDIAQLPETERCRLRRKKVGYVFQSVALIPLMTALENVAFALRLAGKSGNWRLGRWNACGWWGWKSGRDICRRSFPAANSSEWPSPGPWLIGPPSSLPTNARRSWIPARPCRWLTSSGT